MSAAETRQPLPQNRDGHYLVVFTLGIPSEMKSFNWDPLEDEIDAIRDRDATWRDTLRALAGAFTHAIPEDLRNQIYIWAEEARTWKNFMKDRAWVWRPLPEVIREWRDEND